jgi:hypothetical protein
LAYDAIKLNEEVKVYTYFGHARLSIEGLGKGLAVNPKEFTVKCENFNTLPSATNMAWYILLNMSVGCCWKVNNI